MSNTPDDDELDLLYAPTKDEYDKYMECHDRVPCWRYIPVQRSMRMEMTRKQLHNGRVYPSVQ